jgi:hypothetical protein
MARKKKKEKRKKKEKKKDGRLQNCNSRRLPVGHQRQ